MSDSDEDFLSADEGEQEQKTEQTKPVELDAGQGDTTKQDVTVIHAEASSKSEAAPIADAPVQKSKIHENMDVQDNTEQALEEKATTKSESTKPVEQSASSGGKNSKSKKKGKQKQKQTQNKQTKAEEKVTEVKSEPEKEENSDNLQTFEKTPEKTPVKTPESTPAKTHEEDRLTENKDKNKDAAESDTSKTTEEPQAEAAIQDEITPAEITENISDTVEDISDDETEPKPDTDKSDDLGNVEKPDTPVSKAEVSADPVTKTETEVMSHSEPAAEHATESDNEPANEPTTAPANESESEPKLEKDSTAEPSEQSQRSEADNEAKATEECKDVHSIFDKLAGGAQAKPEIDERAESVLEKLARAGEKKQQESSGWGSWGSWGSSILSTATTSVKTFTDQVSDGMHTVVETFEASVGAPPADQLAASEIKLADEISQFVKEPSEEGEESPQRSESPSAEKAERDAPAADAAGPVAKHGTDSQASSDWLHNWGVDALTNQLQSTTKGIVESGLDVLETIGKKTMEQIKENDPGFTKTRGLFQGNKTNLSQILREAQEENERKAADELSNQPLANYSMLFDKHQGMAHLEALEMLSISCTNFMSSNTDELADEAQDRIDSLAEKFTQVHDSDEEGEDELDFIAGIEDFVSKLSLPVKSSKLVSVQNRSRDWLKDCQKKQDDGERIEGREIHSEALNSFSELTSYIMELCHKSGELLLLSPEQERQVEVDQVSDAMISILRLVNSEITAQSHLFNECLNTAADDSEDPDSINPMITDVFLEASNSTSYTRDAFKLLLPVLNKCVVLSTEDESLR